MREDRLLRFMDFMMSVEESMDLLRFGKSALICSIFCL